MQFFIIWFSPALPSSSEQISEKKGRVHLPQLLLISSSLFKTASLLPKTGPCHFQGFSTPHGLGTELSLAISTVYWVTCSVAVHACHLPEKTEPCTPIPSCLQSQFPSLSKCRLRNRYIKRKGLLRSAPSQKKALPAPPLTCLYPKCSY